MFQGDIEEYLNRMEAAFFIIRKRLTPSPEERGGLTGPQFVVLKLLLAQPPGLTASELASRFGVSASAMTGMVDRLVRSGLAERQRSQEDRRVVWVRPTEAGEQALAEAQARRRERFRQAFRRLGEEKLAALVSAMEGAAAALGEDVAPGGGGPG